MGFFGGDSQQQAYCFFFSFLYSIYFSEVCTHHRYEPRAAARLILLVFALANWLLVRYKTKCDSRRFAAACCVLTVLLLRVHDESLPGHFPTISPPKLAREMCVHSNLVRIYVGPVSRGQYFSLNLYLHREMKEGDKNKPNRKAISPALAFLQNCCDGQVDLQGDPMIFPKRVVYFRWSPNFSEGWRAVLGAGERPHTSG